MHIISVASVWSTWNNALTISLVVFQHVSCDLEVLPYDERFHGAHFQGLQGVVHTEAVFACVLRNFIKVATWKTLHKYVVNVTEEQTPN